MDIKLDASGCRLPGSIESALALDRGSISVHVCFTSHCRCVGPYTGLAATRSSTSFWLPVLTLFSERSPALPMLHSFHIPQDALNYVRSSKPHPPEPTIPRAQNLIRSSRPAQPGSKLPEDALQWALGCAVDGREMGLRHGRSGISPGNFRG